MPWFWRSGPSASASDAPAATAAREDPPSSSRPSHDTAMQDEPARERDIIDALTDPQTIVATLILTSAALGAIRLYKTQLRRIPTTAHLRPAQLNPSTGNAKFELTRSKSLLGVVTASNDPDNFRFFHTPGGRLLLWGTPLRTIPTGRALKDQTLSVRMAGIDAPELAHFGKPAQPYGEEALKELRSLIEGRRARVWPLRRDQYERVVCLAFVSRSMFSWGEGWIHGLREEGWSNFWRRDVGLEMIRRGAATVYEGKFGAEFGGPAREKLYRATEKVAKAQSRGMWKGTSKAGSVTTAIGQDGLLSKMLILLGLKRKTVKRTTFESPREYKQRTAKEEKSAANLKHS